MKSFFRKLFTYITSIFILITVVTINPQKINAISYQLFWSSGNLTRTSNTPLGTASGTETVFQKPCAMTFKKGEYYSVSLLIETVPANSMIRADFLPDAGGPEFVLNTDVNRWANQQTNLDQSWRNYTNKNNLRLIMFSFSPKSDITVTHFRVFDYDSKETIKIWGVEISGLNYNVNFLSPSATSGSMAPVGIYWNTSFTIPQSQYNKTGWTFDSWFHSAGVTDYAALRDAGNEHAYIASNGQFSTPSSLQSREYRPGEVVKNLSFVHGNQSDPLPQGHSPVIEAANAYVYGATEVVNLYAQWKKTSTETKTVTRTINYRNSSTSGTILQTKQQTCTFTRQKIEWIGRVNGEQTWTTYGNWNKDNCDFSAVSSPTISGYKTKTTSVAAQSVTPNSSNITRNVVYYPTYKITTSATNASITPSESDIIGDGLESRKISWNPNNGYYISSVKVDGTTQTSPTATGGSTTFSSIKANHTVDVTATAYKKITTTVTGGTITSSILNIKNGENKTISFSPNSGYRLVSVLIDDVNKTSQNPTSVTFNNIAANHTVKVTYEEIPNYTIKTSVVNGIITPTKTDVQEGNNYTVSYSPKDGYRLKSVKVNNSDVSTTTHSTEYEFKNVTTNHTIDVEFEPIPYSQIKFVDVTTNKTLKTRQKVTGTIGSNVSSADSGYTNDLSEYLANGYELVSDEVIDAVFLDTTELQVLHVSLKQSNIESIDTKEITRTIYYVLNNETGVELEEPNEQTLIFTRPKSLNQVTGEITYGDWNSSLLSFLEVETPEISGYYTDIDSTASFEVTPSSSDIDVYVIYNKLQDSVTKFIDTDNDNEILAITDISKGKIGDTIIDGAYQTKLNNLISNGYILDVNGYNTNPKYDDIDDNCQEIIISLKHGQKSENEQKTVKRTINYRKYEAAGDKLFESVEQFATFNIENIYDSVTNELITTNITPSEKNLNAVNNPTHDDWYTLDTDTPPISVSYDNEDIVIDIIYKEFSKVNVIAYDETTDTTLENLISIKGIPSNTLDYNSSSAILKYTRLGYVLEKDETVNYVFGTNGSEDVVYVSFIHGTVEIRDDEYEPNKPINEENTASQPEGLILSKNINRNIEYKFYTFDGDKAADSITQSAYFERTVTLDTVTGEIIEYSGWTSDNPTLPEVISPYINSYIADKDSVPAVTLLGHELSTTETIIYINSKQKAIFSIMNGSEKLFDYIWTGDSGSPLNYNPTEKINSYINTGYELVDNNYPENGIFDRDDDVDQVYIVNVRPIIEEITPDNPKTPNDVMRPDGENYPDGLSIYDLKKTVNRTIYFKYSSGEEALDDVKDAKTFFRTATVNHVTKEVKYNNWTPSENTFEEYLVPDIKNHFKSIEKIEAKSVYPDSQDISTTVVYTQKPDQNMSITFTDTKGQEIATIFASGEELTPFNISIDTQLDKYESLGYNILENNYPGPEGLYDDNEDIDQNFTVLLEEIVETIKPDNYSCEIIVGEHTFNFCNQVNGKLQKDISRKIFYKLEDSSGKEMHEPSSQFVRFNRDAIVNLVTSDINFTDWYTDSDIMEEVKTPYINGFIASVEFVPAKKVLPDFPNEELLVVYRKATQKAIFNFIDIDSGKTMLKLETFGPSSTIIDLSNVNSNINKLLEEDYELIDVSFSDIEKYDSDDSVDQVYMINMKQNSYTVTFISDGTILKVVDNLKIHDSAEEPIIPIKDSYKFVGWSTNAFKDVTENLIIEALWERLYTATFKSDGETLKVEKDIEIHSSLTAPEPPVKPGFKFAGWDKKFSDITEDIVINAVWEELHKVTFMDGFGKVYKEITGLENNSELVYPDNPTMNGYVFIGWDTNVKKVTENMVINARWEKVLKTFTITYDLNGGTINNSTNNIVEGHKENTEITIKSAPIREGYKFLYWKGSQYNPGDKYTVTSDHTFVAQWEEIKQNTAVNTSADINIYYTLITCLSSLIASIILIKKKRAVN